MNDIENLSDEALESLNESVQVELRKRKMGHYLYAPYRPRHTINVVDMNRVKEEAFNRDLVRDIYKKLNGTTREYFGQSWAGALLKGLASHHKEKMQVVEGLQVVVDKEKKVIKYQYKLIATKELYDNFPSGMICDEKRWEFKLGGDDDNS